MFFCCRLVSVCQCWTPCRPVLCERYRSGTAIICCSEYPSFYRIDELRRAFDVSGIAVGAVRSWTHLHERQAKDCSSWKAVEIIPLHRSSPDQHMRHKKCDFRFQAAPCLQCGRCSRAHHCCSCTRGAYQPSQAVTEQASRI